jgi:hypothetical protein
LQELTFTTHNILIVIIKKRKTMGFQRYNGKEAKHNADKAVPKTINQLNTVSNKPGVVARGSRVPVVKVAR